ncbi:MAG: hypothetical protein E8A46_27555 [Bradyrhizobium sp.]|nr:MAG: hypothetical protein E8A46_27555 [Bradyrhizobium sp.]
MRIPSLAWVLAWVVACSVACGGSTFTTAGAGDDGGTASSSGGSADSGGSSGEAGGDDDSGGSPDAVPGGEGGSGEAGGGEGGSGEAGSVEGGPGLAIQCGPQTQCSGATPVCCLGAAGASCAHAECGCETQLECTSDLDCQLPTALCCIDQRQDATCAAGHFAAKCAAACLNGASHLCDPNSQKIQCAPGAQCSNDQSDLQNVGLPAFPGYGVCK